MSGTTTACGLSAFEWRIFDYATCNLSSPPIFTVLNSGHFNWTTLNLVFMFSGVHTITFEASIAVCQPFPVGLSTCP